jgi:RNA recognition motif-containing protein
MKGSLSMKMYVGNLLYNMTEKELKNLFSPFGKVLSSRIIIDQYTRQSKNMGYVEMAVKEEGKQALKELNGKKINNKRIVVKKAVTSSG